MTYTRENTLDMSWDEYTYEVDMMLIAEFGEPATHEQLCDLTAAYNNGVAPGDVFSAMAEAQYGSEYDDAFGGDLPLYEAAA
ncbi:hypothetical protein C8024_00890 [Sphingopyxis sp. BSNA05]|uniref:hypothetical protein n=1 Tax=Sphingopyxis sp. BSNA05 TaxID=1236614 RepID=UPI001565D73B|nr:hypothetical protein [Sphingopyxis sp. BSNA05]NRD88324.1 hypothetical protein [Sphingopyxis sp. BSNA05]